MKPIPRSIALACGAVLLLGAGYAYSNRYAVEHFVMDLSRFCSGQVLMLSGSSFEGHGAFPAQC
jgi:hypothetical protein